MSTTKKASDALATAAESVGSILRLALKSRRASITKVPRQGDRLIILGNGPSLNQTIAEDIDILRTTPTMAVNFAANAPVFRELKPRYYILVDPLFFSGRDLPNLNDLWANLSAVDWEVTLIVPVEYRHSLPKCASDNPKLTVATINAVAVEGWQWLTTWAYRGGWGTPRPRNVLIPAIMAALQMGYTEVYITGADHSWMSAISVNERNEVISVQPHFYKEDKREVKRINTEYLHYPLHQVIHSFYVAFKSYHQIEAYARRRGIHIYNATPGSYIDAFERRPLIESK